MTFQPVTIKKDVYIESERPAGNPMFSLLFQAMHSLKSCENLDKQVKNKHITPFSQTRALFQED
jgi:hypothetical protein